MAKKCWFAKVLVLSVLLFCLFILILGRLVSSQPDNYFYSLLKPYSPFSASNPKIVGGEKSVSNIPKELACGMDSDCGVDICSCKTLNKDFISPSDKICMRVCNKSPRCYKNQCIFKGEEEKLNIEKP